MSKEIDYVYEHQLYFLDKFMQSLNKNVEYMSGKNGIC
jgi:hypothetical protein